MSLHGKQSDNTTVQYLLDGYWKTAADRLVQSDMDYREIMDWCDRHNYYPSNEFQEYVRKELAPQTNKEALDDFFSRVNI